MDSKERIYYTPTEYIEVEENFNSYNTSLKTNGINIPKGSYIRVMVDHNTWYIKLEECVISKEEYDAHWLRKVLIKAIKELD
jgi:hypothetical protein